MKLASALLTSALLIGMAACGGGDAGGGGAGGSGQVGTCTAGDCSGCADCFSVCTCSLGIEKLELCAQSCTPIATGGVGGVGGAAGVGGVGAGGAGAGTSGVGGSGAGGVGGESGSAGVGGPPPPPTVVFTPILQGGGLNLPSSLEFHPTRRNELWILNYGDDVAVTITDPGSPSQGVQTRLDPAHEHFLYKPTQIAMNTGPNPGLKKDGSPRAEAFGTCGDSRNDSPGWGGNGDDFMGPTMFSPDPTIFAEPFTQLGSHLDMIHESPNCMGMAHVDANQFFVFNGLLGSIDYYDFGQDHGAGQDYHGDGTVRRYVEGSVKRIARVPSHLAYDKGSRLLYVADSGNSRIAVLDTMTGSRGGDFYSQDGGSCFHWPGATINDFIPPGALAVPSGLHLANGVLYVTDNASSRIVGYDLTGNEVSNWQTPLAPGSISGVTMSEDGVVYFLDMAGGALYRVDFQ